MPAEQIAKLTNRSKSHLVGWQAVALRLTKSMRCSPLRNSIPTKVPTLAQIKCRFWRFHACKYLKGLAPQIAASSSPVSREAFK
jgi:hypothetical protein